MNIAHYFRAEFQEEPLLPVPSLMLCSVRWLFSSAYRHQVAVRQEERSRLEALAEFEKQRAEREREEAYRRKAEEDRAAKAREAEAKRIAEEKKLARKLLVGIQTWPMDGQGKPFYYDTSPSAPHVHYTGGTGKGKSTLMTRDFARRCGARVLIDYRHEYINEILARLCASKYPAKRVRLIDLTSDDYVVPLNFFAAQGPLHTKVLHVKEIIQDAADVGIQTRDTLSNGMLALAQAGYTLLEMELLFTHAQFRAEVLRKVHDDQALQFFARFERLSRAEQDRLWWPVANKLQILFAHPRLRLAFGAGDCFDFRAAIDDPRGILLISLGAGQLRSAASFAGKLLVGSLHDALFSREDVPGKKHGLVHLFCDEWQNIASDDFHPLVCETRKFGLRLAVAHQSLGQISPKLSDLVRNNMGTHFTFGVGPVDAREMACELRGYSRNDAMDSITGLRRGEVIVVRQGREPVFVQTLPPKPIQVAEDEVAAYRAEILMASARPAAEVEREIRARRMQWTGPGANRVDLQLEVQNENLPRFRKEAI